MRLSLSLPFLALFFFAPDIAAGPHGYPHVARHVHDAIARRVPGDVIAHHNKRYDGIRMTWYDVETGNEVACGGYHSNNDFVVALSVDEFDKSSHCGKRISITANQKTTTAVILDECPGCPYWGLDLTKGLFSFFADEGAGVLTGQWSFVEDNPAPYTPTTDTPTPAPYTPTTTFFPTPTTTEQPPTTTTPPPPSTTWSATSPSFTPSSSSSTPSSSSLAPSSSSTFSSSSNSAIPTGITVSHVSNNTLLAINQAFVALGDIIVAGARHHG